jgi:hypothetical protein
MADLIEIPLSSDFPSQKFTVTILEKVYTMQVRWNDRFARWIWDIMDENENNIVMGIPLHINSDIVGRFRDQRLPRGQFIFYDTSEKVVEAGRDDLGDRCKLLFRPFD